VRRVGRADDAEPAAHSVAWFVAQQTKSNQRYSGTYHSQPGSCHFRQADTFSASTIFADAGLDNE
jgi:hypothetical protein